MEEFRREIVKALQCAEHLKFDKSHPWHRNLMALYGALVEYSDSLIHLAMAKKSVAIPVVFRSFLEAYVDFKNLAEDRRYGNHMEASYSKEWLRVLEEAEERKNPYLVGIGSDAELMLQIQHHKDRLTQLKADGYQPLSHYTKFEKAGMVEEYRSIYNFFCSDSHNNIRSLIDRFIIIDKEKNDFELVFFKDSPSGEFDHYLSTALHLLRNGSHNIHAVLETGYEHVFPV
ncbi:DUF5677 domain-containing protein [Marinobacter sp.]|uniref:DUF5677 domain-containing protein n=1 Tax=Marinobacter sp. TaxID=50741 RepID=UPI003B51F388